MKKTEEIYVFGHKNPDTDAVTSAINLSYLKNQLGMNTAPRVLGNINNETEFVLNYFNVKKPEYLNNVKLQIKDLDYNNKHHIEDNNSIYFAYNYMTENNINNIPILNPKNEVEGIIAMKHIAKYMISGDSKILNASYENVLETLEAEQILKFDNILEGTINIAAFKNTTFIENVKIDNNSIILVGDRYKVLEHSIKNKAKLIVLTGNHDIPEELLELAKENKVNIIKTSFHTYEASKMISLSNYAIQIAIKENIVSVSEDDLVSDFIDLANKTKYTYFPVVDKNKKFIGNIEPSDTNKQNRKQVMLTDHNEYDQSVDGLHEAEILEIVDHHNIGSIGTMAPINFRSMPVGSSNTVLYKMYKEHNIEIPKENAGLMLSGIISDTLLLVSPTTTELDKETAKELAEIAGVNLNKYGLEMLKAGTSLKGKTEEDILFGDFKMYEVNNKKICVTQVSTFDINDFNDSIEKYKELLNKNAENNNYDVFAFFITDILKNGSYVYYNDSAQEIMEKAFDIKNMEQGTYIDGCVSRKKQVIPKLMRVLD
jgi:manganese-dependent inorganic pyrophosphatase